MKPHISNRIYLAKLNAENTNKPARKVRLGKAEFSELFDYSKQSGYEELNGFCDNIHKLDVVRSELDSELVIL